MSNYETILTSVEDGIALIQLNRPRVLNAINRPMVTELLDAFEGFDRNDEVKAIVLTGNSRAFAAGADIDEMKEDDSVSLELLNQFKEWDRLATIKKPIIGAVNGYCFGGGFELALCADILFAAENAQFGFPEIKLGVMPGAGGTVKLTKLMGQKKALEWLWLGDPMTADEALGYGVINRVVAPELVLEEAKKYAKLVASRAPLSVRLIKETVYKSIDYSTYEGMQFERKNFYLLFSSQDQKEGMKAFVEKRPAEFKGK
ncbi:enoyl-CoA hydratase-related protein [Fictibacillus nanhaiensis]|jgi:enoyl-CoA hydratase|uniref:enoyl-CoA hydratase/isomerase family protein n=1 Tax=Fictibacillus nanhaiensis TaxID=742169 RepID=UPI0020418AD0|nr:enoyl-CoA hydratase-related protein [Fictibacillus nanhaiensis]MCM3732902.1 enoyl-CoA hydratase-related protein [Fictibacillus nanhaiensis]